MGKILKKAGRPALHDTEKKVRMSVRLHPTTIKKIEYLGSNKAKVIEDAIDIAVKLINEQKRGN